MFVYSANIWYVCTVDEHVLNAIKTPIKVINYWMSLENPYIAYSLAVHTLSVRNSPGFNIHKDESVRPSPNSPPNIKIRRCKQQQYSSQYRNILTFPNWRYIKNCYDDNEDEKEHHIIRPGEVWILVQSCDHCKLYGNEAQVHIKG
jgi:hypothetical protein